MRPLYGRKRYRVGRIPVRLHFWRVLMALDIVGNPALTLDDKISAACALFCRFSLFLRPRTKAAVVAGAFELLFPARERSAEMPVMDFRQDAAAIRSSFRQAYGIDLDRARLSFQDFLELLEGLPDDTIFAKIVDIRRRPLPTPTKHNAKEIEALQRAKKAVAIKVSDEDRARIFAESLKNSTF